MESTALLVVATTKQHYLLRWQRTSRLANTSLADRNTDRYNQALDPKINKKSLLHFDGTTATSERSTDIKKGGGAVFSHL